MIPELYRLSYLALDRGRGAADAAAVPLTGPNDSKNESPVQAKNFPDVPARRSRGGARTGAGFW